MSFFSHAHTHFTNTLTSGYVFKSGHIFKEVYGHGLINAITADWCYYPWKMWGFGTKLSYWRGKGETNFLKKKALLQQIPVAFYARFMKDFKSRVQIQCSLGGGFTWIKEKSYKADTTTCKGIGEVEAGLSFPIYKHFALTGSVGYLFPPQKFREHTIDVGGLDLRAGIGIQF